MRIWLRPETAIQEKTKAGFPNSVLQGLLLCAMPFFFSLGLRIIFSTKWGSGKEKEMSTMQTGPWEPALINGRFYGSFVKKET